MEGHPLPTEERLPESPYDALPSGIHPSSRQEREPLSHSNFVTVRMKIQPMASMSAPARAVTPQRRPEPGRK